MTTGDFARQSSFDIPLRTGDDVADNLGDNVGENVDKLVDPLVSVPVFFRLIALVVEDVLVVVPFVVAVDLFIVAVVAVTVVVVVDVDKVVFGVFLATTGGRPAFIDRRRHFSPRNSPF